MKLLQFPAKQEDTDTVLEHIDAIRAAAEEMKATRAIVIFECDSDDAENRGVCTSFSGADLISALGLLNYAQQSLFIRLSDE